MDKQKYQKELEVIDKAIDVCLNDRISVAGVYLNYPKEEELKQIQERFRNEGGLINLQTVKDFLDVYLERKTEELKALESEMDLPSTDTRFNVERRSDKIALTLETTKSTRIQAIYEENYRYIKDTFTEWEDEEKGVYSYRKIFYGKKDIAEVELPIDEFLSYYEECKEFLEYSEEWKARVELLRELVSREQEKVLGELYQLISNTTNDKQNLSKEINLLSRELFSLITRRKEDFRLQADDNKRKYEIKILGSPFESEEYEGITGVLSLENKRKFQKYLLEDASRYIGHLETRALDLLLRYHSENGENTELYKDIKGLPITRTEDGFTVPIDKGFAIECTLNNFKKVLKIEALDGIAERIVDLAWEGEKIGFIEEEDCNQWLLYRLLWVRRSVSYADFTCLSFFEEDKIENVKKSLERYFLSFMYSTSHFAYREFIQENGLYKEDSESLNPLTTEEIIVFVDKKKGVYQEIINKRNLLDDLKNRYLAILEDNVYMIKKDEAEKARSDLFFVDGIYNAILHATTALEDIKKYDKLNVYNLALLIENERLSQKGYQKWQDVIRTHRARVKKVMSEDNAETDGGLRESINSELKKMETCLEEIKALINKSIALTNEVIK